MRRKRINVMTQSELNSKFEYPVFNLAEAYAEVLKVMLFTGFYAVVIPFSILFGIVQILALYWVYKWNLLRRSNLNRIVGHLFPFSFLEL